MMKNRRFLNRKILLISWIIYGTLLLNAQSKFDLRLQRIDEASRTENEVCYEVQLRSASTQSWGLAGQNYRLFYDASKLTFKKGESLLGSEYQAFTLIQNVENINAAHIDGDLSFSKNLGFLNYAIDLNNSSIGGLELSTDDNWLTTTKLCFTLRQNHRGTDTSLEIIWAKDEKTNAYANSFVEVAEWVGQNKTQSAQGGTYFDILSNTIAEPAQLAIKVFLQSIFEPEKKLMRDDLRKKGLLPLEEPYSKMDNFSPSDTKFKLDQPLKVLPEIFEKEGNNAIVDWIFVELRDKNTGKEVIWATAGLLQRDGDVVDTDGYSALSIPLLSDSFHLVIRHRNHLGIMSKEPIFLENNQTKTIDFTSDEKSTYGLNATVDVFGFRALWGGNANGDEYITFSGGGIALPDTDRVFFDVFLDPTNIYNRYNHIVMGYYSSDVNMDGEIRYQGGENDVNDFIFFNNFLHPENEGMYTNFYMKEQIPD